LTLQKQHFGWQKKHTKSYNMNILCNIMIRILRLVNIYFTKSTKLIQKISQKLLKKSRLFAYKFTVIFPLCHRILASALASQELFCQALPWQQLQLCLSPRRIYHNMRRLRNMALTVSFDVVTFHPGKIVLAEPETSGQPASGSFRACFHGSLLLLHASKPAPTLHRRRPRCLLKLNSIQITSQLLS